MMIDDATCRALLTEARFGVLGTVNADSTPHLVPAVFAVMGSVLVIPVDRVKPKRSTRLRRVQNLEARPHATFIIDRRSDDWEQLWWVRADLVCLPAPPEGAVETLVAKYSAYRSPDAIAGAIGLSVTALTGWAASPAAIDQ
jgi:PPOX class probable F420-dependent enzyme